MNPYYQIHTPKSVQRPEFTKEYEPYKVTFLNLSAEALKERLSSISHNACEFTAHVIVPSIARGEFPNKEQTEALLHELGIDTLRIERGFRFVKGFCAQVRNEFLLRGEWPVSIERDASNKDRYTLTVDLPSQQYSPPYNVTSPHSRSSGVNTIQSAGAGWCFADELAARCHLPTISHSCRDGWSRLQVYPGEADVSLQLEVDIQLQLCRTELLDSSCGSLTFPRHIPKEITLLSSEGWKQNQFARTVDTRIGPALVASGLLAYGCDSLAEEFQHSDDLAQEIAVKLHKLQQVDTNLLIARQYARNNTATGEPSYEESGDFSHHSSYHLIQEPTPFEELSIPKRAVRSYTTAKITAESTIFKWSSFLDIGPLDIPPVFESASLPKRFLTTCIMPAINPQVIDMNGERWRQCDHIWDEGARIAIKCGAATTRSAFENYMLQHRNRTGYPSTVSESFTMQMGDDLAITFATT